MSDEPDEPKLIVSEINIIYKPKPKRLFKANKKLSTLIHLTAKTHENKSHKQKIKKRRENLTKNGIAKSQNFDLISLEEIENDFKELKAKSEIFEVENELLKLLQNSTKDTSFEEERKNKIIERPKNIFYKNFE